MYLPEAEEERAEPDAELTRILAEGEATTTYSLESPGRA